MPCPHFDIKADADKLWAKSGVPTTCLQTTFYFENFGYFFPATQMKKDGPYMITFPMGKSPLSMISGGDIGRCAFGIIANNSNLAGKTIAIGMANMTGDEIAKSLQTKAPKDATVAYYGPSRDEYAGYGFPHAVGLANMFHYYDKDSKKFCGDRDPKETKKLSANCLSWDEYLKDATIT
eukprot:UN32107